MLAASENDLQIQKSANDSGYHGERLLGASDSIGVSRLHRIDAGDSQVKHEYATRLVWEGNNGSGTAEYATYGRQYRVLISGKPDIEGSADPVFRGDAAKHNPEDLFVAAISSCHLLSYLALCARNKIGVVSYEDEAIGTMSLTPDGGGKFDEVVLRPCVTIMSGDLDLAINLHETAHHQCYVANSCSCVIRNEPSVTRGHQAG